MQRLKDWPVGWGERRGNHSPSPSSVLGCSRPPEVGYVRGFLPHSLLPLPPASPQARVMFLLQTALQIALSPLQKKNCRRKRTGDHQNQQCISSMAGRGNQSQGLTSGAGREPLSPLPPARAAPPTPEPRGQELSPPLSPAGRLRGPPPRGYPSSPPAAKPPGHRGRRRGEPRHAAAEEEEGEEEEEERPAAPGRREGAGPQPPRPFPRKPPRPEGSPGPSCPPYLNSAVHLE